MKLATYIKKGFLFILSLMLPYFLIALFFGNLNIRLIEIQNIFYFIIGFSVFFGTLYYVYDIYFGPNERVKELKKEPFTEFKKLGFKNYKTHLLGKINGYSVLIGYHWRNNDGLPIVYTKVLFDPRVNGKHINNYDLYKWQKSIKNEYNFWEYGRLTTEFPLRNKATTFKVINNKLITNIKLISNKNLGKISFKKWKKDIESHINSQLEKENNNT